MYHKGKYFAKEYIAGKSLMKGSFVSICSIVRDCEFNLAKNIPRIEQLRLLFKDSEVIVFENDSKELGLEVTCLEDEIVVNDAS